MSGETPDTTPTVLEVAGIDVRFEGVVALDGVSLTVRANQIVGVIGPNGAGKTTLFNAVSRFVTPVAGTITYQGRSLLELPTWRLAHMGIARTLQGVGLWPTLTVLDNVVAGSPSRTRLAADLLAFPSCRSPHRVASRGGPREPRRAGRCRSCRRPIPGPFRTASRSGSSSLAP